jgi:hypothetical protein
MKTRLGIMSSAVAVLVLLAVVMAPQPARATLDISFGAAVHTDDDTDVYLAVSTRYFERDRADVNRWNRECRDPDDLAVALFIASHCGKNPDLVFSMHKGGLSWWDVSLRLGVKPDVWFVPVRRDPGPPYGKAYGYHKKHGHHPDQMRLTDADLRNLVAVRVLHDYYGVSAEVAMDWRSSGRSLREITAGEYRTRHGKSHSASAKKSKHGHGKAKHKR